MTKHQVTYSVETLRSGQPRAYADTENEYLITMKSTSYGKDGLHPWLQYGDVEAMDAADEVNRKAGRMSGGLPPGQRHKEQQVWAKRLVRALCQNFRERGDDDGKVEGTMDAHFYPTLKSLTLDPKAGTVRAFIVEAYTD